MADAAPGDTIRCARHATDPAFPARSDDVLRPHLPRPARGVDATRAGTGGPCTYTGRTMQAAHKGMGITDAQFGALVEDLQKTLVKFKVPEKEQGDLLAVLGPMKPQIVGQ